MMELGLLVQDLQWNCYNSGPASAGPSTSTIAAAGDYPSPAAYTTSEEFIGGTETATAKTLTSS